MSPRTIRQEMLLIAGSILLSLSPHSVASASDGCSAIVTGDRRPINVTLVPISGRALNGRLIKSGAGVPTYRVGRLTFQDGEGFTANSNDRRFRALIVSSERGLHHPCGYAVGSAPTVAKFFGSGASQGRILLREVNSAPKMPHQGMRPAAPPKFRDFTPLPGVTSMGSNYGRRNLGLMRSRDGRRTLVVRFSTAKEGGQVEILADLPYAFQQLAYMPPYHLPSGRLTLRGKNVGEPLHEMVLYL